jgi:DNA-directed RNA polymerase specialized sigma24 family protein
MYKIRTAADSEDTKVTGYRDQTDMGGLREAFLTTHWSLVGHIQSENDKDRVLIGLLLDRYWKPVYCYLRRKGNSNEDAKDLTQGFFHEVVMNKDLVQRADPSKGRFRTFLLHALDQYLLNEKRKQATQKRSPKGKLVSFDVLSPPVLPEAVSRLNPEDSYNYAWTASILDQVLSEVEAKCLEDGLEVHWRVFQDGVVQPILKDTSPPSFEDLCRKYGIDDQKKAANMVTTVKRRLQKALKQYIRNTATSDDETHEEFSEIIQFFSRSAQHSG